MRGQYLIPANSKKMLLIFGLFNTFDLILFGTGVLITLIMMMVVPIQEIVWAIIAILPVAVTGFLVFPIPNYHNVLTVIIDVFTFFTQNQRFRWKGWCFLDEYKESKR